jgi:hypothetical protein
MDERDIGRHGRHHADLDLAGMRRDGFGPSAAGGEQAGGEDGQRGKAIPPTPWTA